MTDKPMCYESISPAYRRLNIHIWTTVFCCGVLVAFAGYLLPQWQDDLSVLGIMLPAGSGIAIVAMSMYLYHWFADPLIRYHTGERTVSLKKGLFFRSDTCQPIKRIQHIEIKRGPLERRRDLSSLYIYSAGGAAHTLMIPGIPSAHAEQLKGWILAHKDTAADF